MICLYQAKELSDDELIDLKGFVNTIIIHNANGNKNEKRLVNIMGGTIIETESEKLMCRGAAMKILKVSEVQKLGTEALVKALDPIGMARYLERYDNGGQGDYTKEKYDQPDDSIGDILAMADRL